MRRVRFQTRAVAFVSGVAVALLTGLSLAAGDAPKSTVVQEQNSLQLRISGENGRAAQETIPIHQAGPARYFSAGVGVEERAAVYPPFALKLVFVEGPKAYLSGVSVSIMESHGKVQVKIPSNHVNGPWLFVDLPPGTYEITAVGPNKAELKEHVTIAAHQSKTVHLRWKAETA